MSLTTPVPNPPSSNARPSRVRYRVLALIASLSVLTYLDRVCISRVQGDIQRDLGLSDVEMGAVFGAFMVGYALFEMPVGWLSDMWGTRKVILRIVLWWSFFTALTGGIFNFFPESRLWLPLPWGWTAVGWGFASMVLVRFLFGCGEAGVYPTLANVVRTWFPLPQRALAQGVILMSNRVGAAISPLVIGQLANRYGWRLAFVAFGLLGVVWSMVFARIFRERPAEHPGVDARELALIGTPSVASVHSGPRLPWREALRSPTVWGMAVLYTLAISFGWAFYVTWQPRYFNDVYNIDFQQSELWIGLPYLCGAAGCLLGGRLSDWIVLRTGNLRLARSIMGMVGLAGAGVCFLAASVIDSAWQTAVLFSIAAFSSDLFLAPFWAAITDVGGRFTGTLAGMFNMLALLGAGMFVTFIPWLLKHDVAWQHVIQIIACAWLAAAAMWLVVDAGKPLLPLERSTDPDV